MTIEPFSLNEINQHLIRNIVYILRINQHKIVYFKGRLCLIEVKMKLSALVFFAFLACAFTSPPRRIRKPIYDLISETAQDDSLPASSEAGSSAMLLQDYSLQPRNLLLETLLQHLYDIIPIIEELLKGTRRSQPGKLIIRIAWYFETNNLHQTKNLNINLISSDSDSRIENKSTSMCSSKEFYGRGGYSNSTYSYKSDTQSPLSWNSLCSSVITCAKDETVLFQMLRISNEVIVNMSVWQLTIKVDWYFHIHFRTKCEANIIFEMFEDMCDFW